MQANGAEGCGERRNHRLIPAPISSLLHHEFTDHAYTCIARSPVPGAFHLHPRPKPKTKFVSVALVLPRLCRIYDAATGVTRMAFRWSPDVPPSTLEALRASAQSDDTMPQGCWAIIERAVRPLSHFSDHCAMYYLGFFDLDCRVDPDRRFSFHLRPPRRTTADRQWLSI